MTDRILILDFGSQVTQLIARRVREQGVYSEIWPFNTDPKRIAEFAPKGIILSGGPASVTEGESPRAPRIVFELSVPVLGICYGQQAMCAQLGGEVQGSDHREFGRAFLEVTGSCVLFDGLWKPGDREQVWMSHGDRVVRLPPGFRVVGVSDGAPFAVCADDQRRYYGVMFHPEVVHTPQGGRLLGNFVRHVAGCAGDWTMAAFKAQAIERIRHLVGKGRVICGLSGGVDSADAAVLIHEAIGDQLHCIFVDHGLLRHDEGGQVVALFRDHYNIPLVHRDAGLSSSVASPESRTRRGSARSSAGSSSMCSRRRPRRSAAPISWPRAPSIPMSSSPCPSPAAPASPSSRTTMSAACRSACGSSSSNRCASYSRTKCARSVASSACQSA
jgi:GMP synthase (glutamine-hydrolysing)